MSKSMPLAEFTRLPAAARAMTLDGLSGLIDMVAEGAVPAHHFLRYQYYAAALAASGGDARTIIVESDGDAVIALPMIHIGPRPARIAGVPGARWPLRGFPARLEAGDAAFDALLIALGREANALVVGPVPDDDPTLVRLIHVARARRWAVLDRPTPFEPAPIAFDQASDADRAFWNMARTDPIVAEALDSMRGAAPGQITPKRRDWLFARPGLPALITRMLAPYWRRSAG